jgi:hypothetical protein
MKAYSVVLNPIEEAFAESKGLPRKDGSRSRRTLVEAMGNALHDITVADITAFLSHRRYRTSVQSL